MASRPPILPTKAAREAALGALEEEILAERAASLGRAARRLEAALATLAADAGGADDRASKVAEAREALWALVVQREACGFRNSDELIVLYAVPPEVSAYVVTPRIRPYWQR